MIIKFSQLSRLRKSLHNKKVVFAGGTFDLLHRGHIESFKNLRKLGDVVVIAISSDKRVKERKGNQRPILSEKERLMLMDSIRYINYCFIAPRPARNKPVPTMRILNSLRPDIFVSADKRWIHFRSDVEKLGVKLKVVPRAHKSSTSRIIAKIIRGYHK